MVLTLKEMKESFAICRLDPKAPLPDWATRGRFYSITQTPKELSIVCEEKDVPANVKCEKPWSALEVQGPLDFSLTGILSALASTLAKGGVSLFAISTFDTDYLLVKKESLAEAITLLQAAGNRFVK